MKRNIRQCLIVAATALSFAACDVKDPIYNTPHPEQGAITLVTDWSGIGEGLTAPASDTVEAGESDDTASLCRSMTHCMVGYWARISCTVS